MNYYINYKYNYLIMIFSVFYRKKMCNCTNYKVCVFFNLIIKYFKKNNCVKKMTLNVLITGYYRNYILISIRLTSINYTTIQYVFTRERKLLDKYKHIKIRVD